MLENNILLQQLNSLLL